MNPFENEEFWRKILGELQKILQSNAEKILSAGAFSGLRQLQEAGREAPKWPSQEEFIRQYAVRYAFSTALGITKVTRSRMISTWLKWQKSGEAIEQLVKDLAKILGPERAESIAVTETTRAYAEGSIAYWKSSGKVRGKRWRTAEDELVCPVCGPLAEMVVELDSNGFTTEIGEIGLFSPPAHVNCRCWLVPFVEEIP